MCELLGISSDTPDDYKDILRKFFTHSYDNPHGWGIMFEKNECKTDMDKADNERLIVKEPVSAGDSDILEGILDEMGKQNIVMAHIRYATVGSIKYDNCHPYTASDASGREWTLIHNGTIYSGSIISEFTNGQKGDTDSERIFLYILTEINKAITVNRENLSAECRFNIIDKIICALSQRNKINIMIYDGEFLYAHKNMKNTLSFKRQKDGIILATKPLDKDNWMPLPMTQLLAFKDGKLVFEGTNHGNVFVPALENITRFDAMNI